MSINFTKTEDGVVFVVRVIPRASRTETVGEHDGTLKVRVASPPVKGAANTELIKLFAKAFGVAKSDVAIIAGKTSKTKRIRITGATAAALQSVLAG